MEILYSYRNGGLYLDIKSSLDKQLFKNIIKEDDICLLDRERNELENYRQQNLIKPSREQYLLIFCRGHPYLKYMIDILVKNIMENNIAIPCDNTYSSDVKQKILRLSGPDAFSAAINLCITHKGILHRDIFYESFSKLDPIERPMYITKHYSQLNLSLLKN